jgi:hypothetical protein
VKRDGYDQMNVRVMTRDDRESKLPVWAQDVINGLRRRVGDAINMNEDLLAKLPVSPVVVDTYGVRPDVYLSPDAMIRFDLDAHRKVYVRLDEGRVRVTTDGNALVVYPNSSNHVSLDVVHP